LRVAFLGPAGTFTEEALLASASEAVEPVPFPTVYETVMAVQEGAAERGLVPIENSLEGGVGATLDALAGEAERVRIAGEVVHPVRHCLIAAGVLPLEEVTQVISHPQATAQCAGFLRDRLPRSKRVVAASTADAVRQVRDSTEPWAALGSRLSAEIYDCTVLGEGVEDHSPNLTRFVWLAGEDAVPPPPGRGVPVKTSIVFWGFNDASPGALVSVLSEFSNRRINLTKIESRPRRVRLGHYMFFADLEGGQGDPLVTEALEALAGRVETLRVLGSYPAVAEPDG
jgi:prephenate dehydratase